MSYAAHYRAQVPRKQMMRKCEYRSIAVTSGSGTECFAYSYDAIVSKVMLTHTPTKSGSDWTNATM